MATTRALKTALYLEFARLGHALSSPTRLELLDLLAQGERSVDGLTGESGEPLRSVSAHLRVLREARLVETRRDGTRVYYRLASEGVFPLLRDLQSLAWQRLADARHAAERYLQHPDEITPVTLDELRQLQRRGEVTIIDVRPREEYDAGHIPGALSMPVPELRRGLRSLPANREIVAYCRGPWCVQSVEAVGLLRSRGRRARRAAEGVPHWRARGWPVERTR